MKRDNAFKETVIAIGNKASQLHLSICEQPLTPIALVVQCLDNLDIDGKSVITVNPDIFLSIKEFKKFGLVNPMSITLVTDIKALQGKPDVIYVESFKEIKLNKKFDVAIINPPYQEYSEKNQTTSNNAGNKKLASQIFNIIRPLVEYVAIIMPQSQISNLKTLSEHGLYKREASGKYFPSSVKIRGGIYTYYFSNSNVGLPLDKLSNIVTGTTLSIHSNNIGNLMKSGIFLGKTRNEVVSKVNLPKDKCIIEAPVGSVRVWLSASTGGYLNANEVTRVDSDSKWRVICANNDRCFKMHKTIVIPPGDVVTSHASFFAFDTEDQAILFDKYLHSEYVTDILAKIKVTTNLAKKFLAYIPLPDFLK